MNPNAPPVQAPVLTAPRLWRVTLALQGKQAENGHRDVLAVNPMMDPGGLLLFFNSLKELTVAFAPGTWVSVELLPVKPAAELELAKG